MAKSEARPKPKESDQNYELIVAKSNIKQLAYTNTFSSFNLLKEALKELVEEFRKGLEGKVPAEVLPVFIEKGPFEAEFQLAGDLLVFSMHSNVFVFNREHPIWKIDYVKDNPLNSYSANFQPGFFVSRLSYFTEIPLPFNLAMTSSTLSLISANCSSLR